MVYLLFLIAAVITVISAIKISKYADVIGEKTSLGGLLMGTVLLASATSLPEVTTSVSAVVINNPDIAVGNVLGSNMFNLSIIAVADIYFRKKKAFLLASAEHKITATLGVVLTLIVLIDIASGAPFKVFGVGISSILIVILYVVGTWALSAMNKKEAGTQLLSKRVVKRYIEQVVEPKITVKRAKIGFVGCTVVILFTGSALAILGDRIADMTGIGSTFVGSFLIASTTSLPEVVCVYTALKLSNVNLAIGTILGSNTFNMLIISLSDGLYRPSNILAVIDPVQVITAFGVLIMSLLILLSLFYRSAKSAWSYSIPSFMMAAAYIIFACIIFTS